MSQQKVERRRLIARGGGGSEGGVKERKQEWLLSLNSSVPATLDQWVISTSLATNIYLKLFTEGTEVQLESRG